MLHILLLLLKIIGIIILCILGTIIFVLICILFVPVCYRIEVSRSEGENEPPVVVRAKVTWLLHFVNVLMIYATELYLRARLLFIPVFRLPRKEKKKAGKRKKKEKGKGKKEKGEEQKEEKEEKKEEKEEKEQKKEEIEQREEKKEKREKKRVEERAEKREEARVEQRIEERTEKREEARAEQKEKRRKIEKIEAEHGKEAIEKPSKPVRDEKTRWNFVHKLHALWEKVHNFIENIQYTIRNICDKIKTVWNDVEYYSDVVKSDVFQNTFVLCKKELCRLLKGILPGTIEADLVVGMDDPAATGQILAACGMLYPILGRHVNVVGDFEQKRLEGSIFMKGRVYGVTLLYVCVKLYFNGNVKKLYKLLKKEAV